MTQGIKENEPDAKVVYADIIDLPHHRSPSRVPMSHYERAAQFSSFAALVGYEDMIAEEGRLTDSRKELTDDELTELNKTLYELSNRPNEDIPVNLTYFKPDMLKSGGAYVDYEGIFRYYNAENHSLVFKDKTELTVDSIVRISIEEL